MTRALRALLLLTAFVSCREREAPPKVAEVDAGLPPPVEPPDAAPLSANLDAGTDAFAEPAFSACTTPSVTMLRAWDDARTVAALGRCLPDGGGFAEGFDAGYGAMVALEQPKVDLCGTGDQRKPDIPRMIDSALPFDWPTYAHVRAIFRDGQTKGRRAEVFGLVGDSITIDYSFMKPFRVDTNVQIVIDSRVHDALAIDGGRRTVVDLFHGQAEPGGEPTALDSFYAPRAAKIGARAPWVLGTGNKVDGITPLDEMIVTVSPAYAVIMFGTNDAEWYVASPEKIAQLFGADLRKVIDAVETRGIIPILTTLPKHMHDKRFPDCSSDGASSNARFAIQTSAVSAEVARIACERHLPLIDYRYALDALLDHGVGHDGVHPSVYVKGGGFLDENGLQCGFNVRNLVTLRMLKLVYDAVSE